MFFCYNSGIKLEKEEPKENDHAFVFISDFYFHENKVQVGLGGGLGTASLLLLLQQGCYWGDCGSSDVMTPRNFPSNFDLSSKLMIRKIQICFWGSSLISTTHNLLFKCSS